MILYWFVHIHVRENKSIVILDYVGKKKKNKHNCDMHLTVWGEQYDMITKPRYVWQCFAVLGNNYCAKG